MLSYLLYWFGALWGVLVGGFDRALSTHPLLRVDKFDPISLSILVKKLFIASNGWSDFYFVLCSGLGDFLILNGWSNLFCFIYIMSSGIYLTFSYSANILSSSLCQRPRCESLKSILLSWILYFFFIVSIIYVLCISLGMFSIM